MGGREAIRGFAIQTLVCLLDAVALDNTWIAVTLEPDSSNDKVDILWQYADHIKFVQVKSSKNVIGKSDVEGWAEDLKKSGRALIYELRLAGPVAAGVFNTNVFNDVQVPTPSSISLLDLTEQAVTKLDKYLTSKGIDAVPVGIREELVDICASRLLSGSSVGTEVSREAFDGWLLHWLTSSYPQALAARLASNCEILWGSFDLLPPVPASRAFTLRLPLSAFNAGRGAAIIEWFVVQVACGSRRMIYAPTNMITGDQSRPFSKFVVSPGRSVEFQAEFSARAKAGFSADAWSVGVNTLELFAKFAGAESPRLVARASVTITGDHMSLLNGEGLMRCPVSSLEDYIDNL
ncbi:hypothetical protein [Brucella pituitosa]|uniref:hypothetical protein n=1 Tax=Brucella pituitosa TaxID=571256 RepID=UPI000C26DD63|nr:hypothetical protein [Brucella pituitosa]PJO48112.1 hypothetical protein CWE02_10355 [Brucella pituitosa]